MAKKICCLLLLFISCSQENHKLRIVSWNVQNLFDIEWQGTEYPEYDPRPRKSGHAWTAELLKYRFRKLSKVLDTLDADIYALIEVESEQVLKQLNQRLERPFPYFLLLRQQNQAVNMGLLSRLPIVRSARHEVGFLDSGRALRAIVEIELELSSSKDSLRHNSANKLILLLNHWKSQRGVNTASARNKAAAILNQRGQELRKKMKEVYIIALGDFNEALDSQAHKKNANDFSFWPGPKKGLLIAADPFAKMDKWFGAWFSPWFAYACAAGKINLAEWHNLPNACRRIRKLPEDLGSYAFRGKWQTIDNIFLSSAFFQEDSPWQFSSFDVAQFPPLLKETKDGRIPNVWRNDQGVSDHLPLVLELQEP